MIDLNGRGVNSSDLHLHAIYRTEGERAPRRAVIAEVGGARRAAGRRLHWRINWFQAPVDPQLLLAPQPEFSLPEASDD